MADRIELSGLRFFGHHGCTAEERKAGQALTVDAALYLDLSRAGASDDIKATVDYVEAYEDIRAVAEGESADLLETIAERAASRLLARHPEVERVRISVAKAMANLPTGGSVVSVKIRRMRKNGP